MSWKNFSKNEVHDIENILSTYLPTPSGRKEFAEFMVDLMRDAMCLKCNRKVLGAAGEDCPHCSDKLVTYRPEGTLRIDDD